MSSSHWKSLFVTNLFKINIFWFSSITRLKQKLTRWVWYSIFFILDGIPHSSLERSVFPQKWPKHFFLLEIIVKINIFLFSSITWLKQDPTRHAWHFVSFILDDIQPLLSTIMYSINHFLDYSNVRIRYIYIGFQSG